MSEEEKQEGAVPAAEQPASPPDDELTKCRAQAEDYLAGWKRATADYANLKKEMDRMREELSKYACANLVTSLLPALDGFRDAFAHAPKAENGTPVDAKALAAWLGGLGQVRSQLEAALKNAGVTAIDEAGVPFDPSVHDAVLVEKQEGAKPGTVLRVLQAGCRMNDRVLRPAKVVVSE